MASASQRQARWRRRDEKRLIQVRLSDAAVERLDRIVQSNDMRGRAELIERLILASPGEQPTWIAHQAIRLARAWFKATGRTSLTLQDEASRFEIDMSPRRR